MSASRDDRLEDARYVSLATFRKSGARVATPVWAAEDGGKLYVFSEGKAGKVKRLRNSARAQVARCDVRGRLRGDWVDARARIVDSPETIERAYAALRRKYGWQMRLADFFSRLTGRIENRALLELTLGETQAS